MHTCTRAYGRLSEKQIGKSTKGRARAISSVCKSVIMPMWRWYRFPWHHPVTGSCISSVVASQAPDVPFASHAYCLTGKLKPLAEENAPLLAPAKLATGDAQAPGEA